MQTGKPVLVTGGAGSFGKRFIATILERLFDLKRVVVDAFRDFPLTLPFQRAEPIPRGISTS